MAFKPNLLYVPCKTGTGANISLPDAALWGRRYKPQPFLNFLDQVAITAEALPDGFVATAYLNHEELSGDSLVTIVSGAMPGGLTLNQPTPHNWEIAGNPTLVGTYTFTLRITRGSSTMDRLMQIIIKPQPASGSGGVGGG